MIGSLAVTTPTVSTWDHCIVFFYYLTRAAADEAMESGGEVHGSLCTSRDSAPKVWYGHQFSSYSDTRPLPDNAATRTGGRRRLLCS